MSDDWLPGNNSASAKYCKISLLYSNVVPSDIKLRTGNLDSQIQERALTTTENTSA